MHEDDNALPKPKRMGRPPKVRVNPDEASLENPTSLRITLQVAPLHYKHHDMDPKHIKMFPFIEKTMIMLEKPHGKVA